MASSKSIKKSINKLEEQIEECKEIKRRISATKSLLVTLNEDLEDAKKEFYGKDLLNYSDWAYTDDNGQTSIDRGQIKDQIKNVENLITKIGNFINKVSGLIDKKNSQLNTLNSQYKAALAAERED